MFLLFILMPSATASAFNLASSETPFISGSLDQPSSQYHILIQDFNDELVHVGNFSTDRNRNFLYTLSLSSPGIYTASITNLNDQPISTIEISVISDTHQVFFQAIPNIIDFEIDDRRTCETTKIFLENTAVWNYSYPLETPLSSDVSIERTANALEVCVGSELLEPGEIVYEFIHLTSPYGEKIIALEISRKPCPTIGGFGDGTVTILDKEMCLLYAVSYAFIFFIVCLIATSYHTEQSHQFKFNTQNAFVFFISIALIILLTNSDVVNVDLSEFTELVNIKK